MWSLWSNWQYVIVGSDDALVIDEKPVSNDGQSLVHWRMYASLGLNELTT